MTQYENQSSLDWTSLLLVIIPGLLTLLGCLLFLAIARVCMPMVFEPRTYMSMPEEQLSTPLSSNPFSAFCTVVMLPLSSVADTVGLDAMAFMSAERTLLYLLAIFIFLSLLLLLPFYCWGDHYNDLSSDSDDSVSFEPLTQCSISNIDSKSMRLFATVGVTYLFTFIAIAGLMLHLRFLTKAKKAFQRRHRPARYYSVMVEDIPEGEQDAPQIKAWFEEQGYKVSNVTPMRLLGPDFYRAEEAYEKNWLKKYHAERAEAKAREDGEDVPLEMRLPPPNCCETVPTVEHYQEECRELRAEIEEYQRDYPNLEPHSVAFVTFETLSDAAEACSRLEQGVVDLSTGSSNYMVGPAPEPRDVYWRSLEETHYSIWQEVGGMCWIVCATAGVIIMWIPLILGVQALRTWLLNSDEEWASYLVGIVPSTLLMLLNIIASIVLMYIALSGGLFQRSHMQYSWMWQYFAYLIIDSFLLTFFFGSLLVGSTSYSDESTFHFGDNPIKALGNAAPRSASFYFLYILTQALTGIAPVVAFPWSFLMWLVNMAWRYPPGWEKDMAQDPSFPAYATSYALDAFIFAIAFCFGLVAPLVFLAGFLYFLLAHILYKYQWQYNYRTEFQSEGHLALAGAGQVLIGIAVAQMVILSILIVKEFWYGFILVPLIPLTVLVAVALPWIFHKLYYQGLEADLAAEFDADQSEHQQRSKARSVEAAEHGAWIQPTVRENLDHPFPPRFFWRHMRHLDGWESAEDEEESLLDEYELAAAELDADTAPEKPLLDDRSSQRDLVMKSLNNG